MLSEAKHLWLSFGLRIGQRDQRFFDFAQNDSEADSGVSQKRLVITAAAARSGDMAWALSSLADNASSPPRPTPSPQ